MSAGLLSVAACPVWQCVVYACKLQAPRNANCKWTIIHCSRKRANGTYIHSKSNQYDIILEIQKNCMNKTVSKKHAFIMETEWKRNKQNIRLHKFAYLVCNANNKICFHTIKFYHFTCPHTHTHTRPRPCVYYFILYLFVFIFLFLSFYISDHA